jgi:hypothetical protein
VNKGTDLWVIFFYVCYSFLSDVSLLLTNNHRAIFLLLSIFTAIEYSAFAAFLYLNIQSQSTRRILVYISVAFYLSAIYFYFTLNRERFDSFAISFESIIIIGGCIIYLFERISKSTDLLVYSFSRFWIVVGILIYLAGTFFLFSQSTKVDDKESVQIWMINLFFNILKNVIFLFAFTKTLDKRIDFEGNRKRL